MSVVCCEVEVSAVGQSLIQSSPTGVVSKVGITQGYFIRYSPVSSIAS